MITKRILLSTYFLFILGIACSKQKSNYLPAHIQDLENLSVYDVNSKLLYEISLEREQIFGDTEEEFIGMLTDVAVDDCGHVYIADGDQLDIKVYASDGSFLTKLGRQGDGPGEFMEISDIQIGKDKLFAFDRNKQQSVIFFKDSLVYSHTIPIAEDRDDVNELGDGYLNRYLLRGDDKFLMLFTVSNIADGVRDWDRIEIRTLAYLLDKNGNINSEKLFERISSYHVLVPFGGRSVGTPVAFYGTLLTVQSNDDDIYLAWSRDFLIKRYNSDGEYKDAIYYSFRRNPFVPEAVFPEAGYELNRQAVQSMDLPKKSPALNKMLIDDENRLWVSTIVEDFDVYEWWVLEETGELITKFEWPRAEPIEVVRNGYIYTRETDIETYLQQIVRYQINLEEV